MQGDCAAYNLIQIYTNNTQMRRFMDCARASICGVLVLETGLGSGSYRHPLPRVHGLWPETPPFGSSECGRPQNATPPKRLASCYNDTDPVHPLAFEIHEWTKHGICAGVKDAFDYFEQVCSMANAPLKVMLDSRHAGVTKMDVFVHDLARNGFPVWNVWQHEAQVGLAACNRHGKWTVNFSVCEDDQYVQV